MLRIVDQRCSVTPGTAEAPDLTIRTAGETFLGVHRAEINPVLALLTGATRLEGRKELFLVFPRVFPTKPPEGLLSAALWWMKRAWQRGVAAGARG